MIEIVHVCGFDGPNLYGPQPGVFLLARADIDCSHELKDTLKAAGQRIGIVLAYLDITSEMVGNVTAITAHFTTPTPNMGVELARYAVAELNARTTSTVLWDSEEQLWELQRQRRAEALPLPAIQLIAHATARRIPTMIRPGHKLHVGHGIRSRVFDLEQLKHANLDETGIVVPWEQLGSIPIIAIAGSTSPGGGATLVTMMLRIHGQEARIVEADSFEATQALLADQSVMIAVIGLTAGGILERGLGFDRCAYSAVTDMPAALPGHIRDRSELARVLGIPMLVTEPHGSVVLNADVPEIAALADYAPCPVIYSSASAENPIIAQHRATGGAALFIREGLVIAANGPAEGTVAPAPSAAEDIPGILAAHALGWAMGIRHSS